MSKLTRALCAFALCLLASPAHAQITTGTISGRITDPQNAPVPGVSVQARNVDTGLVRETVSAETGLYRLSALPVGSYTVSAEVSGFRRFEGSAVINIATESTLDVALQVAGRSVVVNVTASAPLISTQSSSVGEVVDVDRIEGLPLNGRQFANLAATVPGVGLGFHSDLTKSAQYTPQISGGNGRNINYIVDGGDNNDDTVGGLLQLFPLEAVQEFNVLTQRFDATYGRSNGAVLNVVTKSGTNQLHGSWFTLTRDDAMNARTLTEQHNNVEKQPYERYQFGGSLGGPVIRDRAHFFAAYERTHQNTKQIVDTLGAFPADDGIFDVPFRENLFTSKVTASPDARHYLSLRYARDDNTQAAGAGPRAAHSAWATSTNAFDSLNANHNWIAGRSLLNEAVVQYSTFVNDVPANTVGPTFLLPNSVTGGTYAGAPQRTEQTKWHFRDDVTWTTGAGPGLQHRIRGGVNWSHEPTLRVFSGAGTQGFYTLQGQSLSTPVTDVLFIGNNPTANIPLDFLGVYGQDDWRVSDRLTLNLGLRWDYVDGFPIDQSTNVNFLSLQQAARSGRFAGTFLDEFRHDPRPDRDNVQPRLGAVLDLFGTGRDVLRGGWGLYTDFGYIASNVLTAAFDAAGAGIVFAASDPTGLKKADGTLFRVGDSLDTIRALNTIPAGAIPSGEVVSPLLEQPYTRQANIGWSHQMGGATVVSADYVRVDGRHLNMRVRPNVRINGGPRLLAGLVIPNNDRFRVAVSRGTSQYDGLTLALRRRLSHGVDVHGSYTLANATSDVGTAYDEIAQQLIQDIRDPFGPVQQGPSARTDSRHMVSISAIVQAPGGINIAPIFYYRSALPVHTIAGVDVNADGVINDKTPVAYRYTGLDHPGGASFAEDGPCATVNCSRRAPFSQLNLRVSRGFSIGVARIEAIGEVFNLFNARNPFLAPTQSRTSPLFMEPFAYAGDVGQPEQRVGQIGFRFTF